VLEGEKGSPERAGGGVEVREKSKRGRKEEGSRFSSKSRGLMTLVKLRSPTILVKLKTQSLMVLIELGPSSCLCQYKRKVNCTLL
jgi:hypothetical protein